MHWTSEKLDALPSKKLVTLLENCHRAISTNTSKMEDAKKILEMIEASDRLKEGSKNPVGLPETDPKVQEMKALLEGDNAKALMIKAANEGLPAIRYDDMLLQEELGDWYGTRYHSTATAGGYVGEVMRDLGYEKTGMKPLPEECRAKTASVFAKP